MSVNEKWCPVCARITVCDHNTVELYIAVRKRRLFGGYKHVDDVFVTVNTTERAKIYETESAWRKDKKYRIELTIL